MKYSFLNMFKFEQNSFAYVQELSLFSKKLIATFNRYLKQ